MSGRGRSANMLTLRCVCLGGEGVETDRVCRRSASTRLPLLKYIKGTELVFYGIKNECARTDSVFFPMSEICNGTVCLYLTKKNP